MINYRYYTFSYSICKIAYLSIVSPIYLKIWVRPEVCFQAPKTEAALLVETDRKRQWWTIPDDWILRFCIKYTHMHSSWGICLCREVSSPEESISMFCFTLFSFLFFFKCPNTFIFKAGHVVVITGKRNGLHPYVCPWRHGRCHCLPCLRKVVYFWEDRTSAYIWSKHLLNTFGTHIIEKRQTVIFK